MKKATKTTEKGPEGVTQYRECLTGTEKTRYLEKLTLIDNEDPYEMENWSSDADHLPSILYPDIVNYLVFKPSPYTAEDLKSFKSLEAYNQMVCGWVREVECKMANNKCVVRAKVLHSQRLREKPLQPWVIAERSGVVLAAHCTCMAGLGETCSHVASLLFSVEAIVKIRDSKTVTQEKAYWLLPGAMKNIEYKECRDIDFTSAKSLKKKLDHRILTGQSPPCSRPTTPTLSDQSPPTSRPTTPSSVPVPTGDDLKSLFVDLSTCGTKSAILSLIEPHSDAYIPKPISKDFPTVLTELQNEEALHLNYADLLSICKDISIAVSVDQAAAVEAATREQSDSALWFRFRAGRITASRMKTACHTNPNQPSQSFIKSVCYPSAYRFKSKATSWGCDHEKHARDIFLNEHSKSHENVEVKDTGFFIHPSFPYIGASPDGMVSCDCCGTSVLEIKCPFCAKDEKLEAMEMKKGFCLTKDSNGNLRLDRNHSYYYQVQTQLGVCMVESAYFVVWTEKDLHVELIIFDEEFWIDICKKAEHVFNTAILPELVGKFYSKSAKLSVPVQAQSLAEPSSSSANTSTPTLSEATWCYCGQVESGRMIGCDNPECRIEWFHYLCVGVENAPKGKWYCPDCRKLAQFTSKRGRRITKKALS